MQIQDTFSPRGEVDIILKDKFGAVKTKRRINNLVVQTGKNLVAAAFHGSASDTVTHIGVGSNTPPAAASLGQTALVSEVTPRIATGSTLNSDPATIVYTATFGAGVATGDIAEAGLFTALTSGTLVARTTFSSIPKEADDVLEMTWTLIFG